MARELAPKGIHVAHFVIDGGVRSAERGRVEGAGDTADSLLDPAAIAADLPGRPQAAAQRLEPGGGDAALGGAVLACYSDDWMLGLPRGAGTSRLWRGERSSKC